MPIAAIDCCTCADCCSGPGGNAILAADAAADGITTRDWTGARCRAAPAFSSAFDGGFGRAAAAAAAVASRCDWQRARAASCALAACCARCIRASADDAIASLMSALVVSVRGPRRRATASAASSAVG